jgi:hypothetical protein
MTPLVRRDPPDCCAYDSPLRANFDSNRADLLARKVRYAPEAAVVCVEVLDLQERNRKTTVTARTTMLLPVLSETETPLTEEPPCAVTEKWTFTREGAHALIWNVETVME